MRLDPRDIEAIARRVAELTLAARPAAPPAVRYVDAAEVARALAVERDWVYAHARELGAIRLGGTQGRLRFDLHEVTRALTDDRAEPPAARPIPALAREAIAPLGGTGAGAPPELTSSGRPAVTTAAARSRRRNSMRTHDHHPTPAG